MGSMAGDAGSDLGDLWADALEKYKTETGIDMCSLPEKTWSVTRIVMDQQAKLNAFVDKRHDKGRLDTIRHFMSQNADIIQKVADNVASSASAAFPPSTAILTAFTHVMTASKHVSEDYDMIESFFGLMNTFMQRMSLLEGKLPREAAYQKPLVKVFCSMLGLCAIARSYSVKWGRLTKWMKAMIEGKDSKLSGAYDGLLTSMTELESTTIIRTLRAVMETRDDMKVTQVTLEQTSAMVARMYARGEQVLDVSLDTNAGVREAVSVALETRENAHEAVSILRRQEVRIMRQLMTAQRDKDPDNDRQHDTGARKPHALETVKRNFWNYTDGAVARRLSTLAASLVPGTFEWVEEEAGYRGIVDQSARLLWVTGDAGVGKSSLAYSVFRRLRDALDFDSSASVVGFFSEASGPMPGLDGMLHWCVQQIAEQDAGYCDEVKRVRPEFEFSACRSPLATQTWESLFAAKFPALSDRRLILVLDSVDQLGEMDRVDGPEDSAVQRRLLFQCISDAVKRTLSIQFVLVCSPNTDVETLCREVGGSCLTLTAPRISNDIKIMARARIQQCPRLRKLRPRIRGKIQRRLSDKADSFLYLEHMLRFLNDLGQQRRVLRALEHLPSSTREVYGFLYGECQRNRSDKELAVLRKLLTWLLYSQDAISLRAANCLLRVVAPDDPITVDEELEGRLSQQVLPVRNLKTVSPRDQESAQGNDDLAAGAGEDEEGGIGDMLSDALLDFQEPHMRAYLRDAALAEGGDTTSSRVTMFEMVNSVIMFERISEADFFNSDGLLGEVDNWIAHLLAIEAARTTDEQAVAVIASICGVCTNSHHALKQFELGGAHLLGRTDGDVEKALNALSTWAERGTHLPAGALSDTAAEWVRRTLEEPGHVLMLLARGHVSNWLEAGEEGGATHQSFQSAYSCLAVAYRRGLPELLEIPSLRDYFGRNQPPSSWSDFWQIEPEAFDAVAGAFPHIPNSARRYERLAMALVAHNHVAEALEKARTGLLLAEDDQMRFDLYFLISQTLSTDLRVLDEPPAPERTAESTRSKEVLQQALQASESGIVCGSRLAPKATGRSESILAEPLPLVQLVVWKACTLIRLGECGAAMETIATASRAPEFRLPFEQTEVVVEHLAAQRRWDLIMQLLALSSERHSSQLIAFCRDNTHTLIQYAAKETSREGEMETRYRNAIKFSDANYPGNLRSACRLQLAHFSFGVLGDQAGAKLLLSKFRHDDLLLTTRVLQAIWLLAVILLEEFRAPHLPAKQVALDEMKQLRERVAETFAGMAFEPEMSQLAVPAALMLRKLGPVAEFQATADATFRKCVETLRDDKQSNDAGSFRMLAKALSLLPGLEREAAIAASCQLYIIDMDVYAREEKARFGGGGGDEDASEGDDADIEGSVAPEQQHGAEQAMLGAPMADRDAPAGNGKAEHDVAPDGHPRCGWCEEKFDSWEKGPLYLCYYCPEMDLCESCYRNKIATEEGTAEKPHWRVVCPKGHKHIKVPAEGWRGIKDGVICFQHGSGIKFATWLQELEKKWNAAWEAFLVG
ncbi:hypothetical protein B0T25DRAFT_499441 [Lasiosphaeria hispida]|uniref:NACHT domain-containing protein n=1 Tax=Lasiosphaeria hispida TaxID=260671 RepID=A0AAJ0MGI4_9PEZI|nr:hypothetical protein B0T25DRAFT_499441 [Lasiosphaeria hispida]